MIEYYLPAASTYASDIDNMIWLILIIVGFWFFLCLGAFFYFIFRFRKKEGVPAQYITGEEVSQKRWITIPHFLVLICDVVILVPAIMLWYNIKQDLPEADFARREDPALLEQVLDEHAAAQEAGATGVPAVQLQGNDAIIVGAHPLELYRRWMNRILAAREPQESAGA